jgi:hypothetical protein
MKRPFELCAALVLLQGCAGVAYRPESFGPGKKMAVVGLCAKPKIEFASEHRTLSGLIKSAGSSSYEGDSAPALSAAKPLVFKALAATGKFALVPEKKIVGSAAYKEFPEGDGDYHGSSCVPAKGYKIASEPAALGELAHRLNVDGALVVSVRYMYKLRGANLAGLISAGSIVASAMVTVEGVDAAGTVIWRDGVIVNSDGGIPSVGESVDMEQLRPLLVDATQRAMEKLLTRFAENT